MISHMPTHHGHPNLRLERVTQYGALALIIVMLLGAAGQVGLALSGLPLGLLLITGIITLLLIAPVIMLTTATPAVSVSAEGIQIEPMIWRSRLIRWEEIRAIKPYPLLPPADVEVGRKALTGRRRYRPAEGIMLIVPSLPLQYRFTGLFAGEGFVGVTALTNRSHTGYERLVKTVEAHSPTPPE
jgi:hypothetical protein